MEFFPDERDDAEEWEARRSGWQVEVSCENVEGEEGGKEGDEQQGHSNFTQDQFPEDVNQADDVNDQRETFHAAWRDHEVVFHSFIRLLLQGLVVFFSILTVCLSELE